MRPFAIRHLRKFFSLFGIGLTSYTHLETLEKSFRDLGLESRRLHAIVQGIEAITFYLSQGLIFTNLEIIQSLKLAINSKSQLNQELFVQIALGWKTSGYFVEFGATDGIEGSNTKCLEEDFDWDGILAEPAEIWYPDLYKNRKAKIAKNCVWKKSGEILDFIEADVTSTLASIGEGNSALSQKRVIKVESITLNDLLEKNSAPHTIDYLSIDTEGSEYEILEKFDFKKYKIKVITVEHNFNRSRELVLDLLVKNGFKRVLINLSQFEDWYINESIEIAKFNRFIRLG